MQTADPPLGARRDWIIVLRSRGNDQVVCAMRVDEKTPLGNYWRDPRFRAKWPGGAGPLDNFCRAGRGRSAVRVDRFARKPLFLMI